MATRFHTRYSVTLVPELPRYENYVTWFCFKKKHVNVICGIVAQESDFIINNFMRQGASNNIGNCV